MPITTRHRCVFTQSDRARYDARVASQHIDVPLELPELELPVFKAPEVEMPVLVEPELKLPKNKNLHASAREEHAKAVEQAKEEHAKAASQALEQHAIATAIARDEHAKAEVVARAAHEKATALARKNHSKSVEKAHADREAKLLVLHPQDPKSPQCHFPSGHPGMCLFTDEPPNKTQWDCGECAYRNNVSNERCMCCNTARS